MDAVMLKYFQGSQIGVTTGGFEQQTSYMQWLLFNQLRYKVQ